MFAAQATLLASAGCEAVQNAVKNYSIRRNAEYKVIESDRIKYQCRCKHAEDRFPWSIRGCSQVWRRPQLYCSTMLADHSQLDNSLMSAVIILPMVKTNPSVSVLVLQSAIQQGYHFKSSYRKVWITKKKAIVILNGQ
ncbi:hypothetical protein PIB30_084728 [Stylosanthes scabra]|uniref:Transposase MuDR plant domain-containing protein n=1 Tax=Stylosanthes scabra TaxID=79078 RepID=A0ABU6TS50_9FABA|nr:hypothetical protein [Stylosanthes scabra]